MTKRFSSPIFTWSWYLFCVITFLMILIKYLTSVDLPHKYFGITTWITAGLGVLLPLSSFVISSRKDPPSSKDWPKWISILFSMIWLMWPLWLVGGFLMIYFAVAFLWILPSSWQLPGSIILSIYLVFSMVDILGQWFMRRNFEK